MLQRRRPSWSGAFLLTAGLLAGTGCGGDAAPTEPVPTRSQSQRQGFGPDLVIRELRGPASVRLGETFTATVRVCNEGTALAQGPFGALELGLYLSTDDTLSWPDPGLPPPLDQVLVATVQMNALEAGQCETRGLTGYATPPAQGQGDGAYHLGAIIDVQQTVVELDEANNVGVTVLGVGLRPDLVVTEVHAPASARSGQGITTTVKVCNQGTAMSEQGSVDLYLSSDDTVSWPVPNPPPTSGQLLIGSFPMPELSQGRCALREVSSLVTLPPGASPGQPLYLGVIADAQQSTPELREDNNITVSAPIGVGDAPDLVVTEVHAPANTGGNHPLMATVRVCNQGTQPAPTSAVELHLSVDGAFAMPGAGTPPPPGQTMVGQTGLPPLGPGHCATRDVLADAAPPPGGPLDRVVFMAALVDAAQNVPELREDNNVFVKGPLGVGQAPDLVVTAMTAPPSLSPWGSANASVTVCNEGTESTSMVDVELFLSMVPTLDLPSYVYSHHGTQASIGLLTLPGLDPDQCVTGDVVIHAGRPHDAPPGMESFYLGAIAGTASNVPELREDNNTFVSGLMGVGERPDLVITSLKGPANVGTGSFPVTATVCNQGTQSSYSDVLELYLSTSTFLNAPTPEGGPAFEPFMRTPIGMLTLPPLDPGECRALSGTAVAQSPGGNWNTAYFLGGIVDPWSAVQELREDNNTFIGGVIGVGDGPDLVVTALTGPASVRRNEPFSSALTVCNQGTAQSSPSQAQVFLSTEPSLVLPDWNNPGAPLPESQTPAGELSIPSLSAGQCFTGTASGSAYLPPSVPGEAFHLGAIVDVWRDVEELREENNTFVSGRIGVGDGPDLVVTALTGPASVQPNDAFTATVTVCNQGTASSYSSDLELFFSTTAGLALPRWNGPGAPFPETQAPAGMLPVPYLEAGQCVTLAVPGYAQQPPAATPDQPLYLGAIVDGWGGTLELREDNNTFVSGLVGVGYGPDLVVTAIQAPASVLPNDTFHATVTVCNQGTAPSAGNDVEVHLSSEPTVVMPRWNGPGNPLPATQQPVGSMSVPSLNAGRCFTGSAFATANRPPAATPGQPLYLGVLVDANRSEQELREDNNVFVSGQLSVGEGPDLVITSVTGPASVARYDAFTATVSVCNQGTSASSSTQVEVYLSTEDTLHLPSWNGPGQPMPDTQRLVGELSLPPLQVDDCTTLNIPSWAQRPPATVADGPLYLGAIVGAHAPHDELRGDNNTFVGGLIGVGYGPDLVITTVSAPASVPSNGTFTATVTVCNQGTQHSNGTSLELFFSTQARVVMPQWNGPGMPYPNTQMPLGYVNVQPLNPGQCVTEPASAWVTLPPEASPNHPLYLGAAVDTSQMEAELREDNNTFVSGLMGVGDRPDLVITSLSGPTSVRTGSAFTATVRVCNQGTTTASNTAVDLYLSSSDTLELPPQGGPGAPPESQTLIGAVQVNTLDAGQCVTRNASVTAYTPPDSGPTGFFYLGGIADPWNHQEELREDNNVRADRLIIVAP